MPCQVEAQNESNGALRLGARQRGDIASRQRTAQATEELSRGLWRPIRGLWRRDSRYPVDSGDHTNSLNLISFE